MSTRSGLPRIVSQNPAANAITPGMKVLACDVNGKHEAEAVTGPQRGHTFPVIRVKFSDGSYDSEPVAWPMESVRPMPEVGDGDHG